jgi:sulfotransferase
MAIMNKQYFFLNGVPRAGNTLLSVILNQNPDMQVTANSQTPNLLHRVYSLKFEELFRIFPDHNSLDNVIEAIIPSYYKDWNYKYIIDRSTVGIEDILILLRKYLKNPLKIIVLDRALDEIVASFIRVHKNWNLPAQEQLKLLLQPNSDFMKSVSSINNLSRPEYKDITHFITYNDLVNDPKKTINGIYEFLEVPQYNHYFNDLEKFTANGLSYNEEWYLPTKVEVDLHDVKTEDISFTKHNQLPENILKMVQNVDNFSGRTNGTGA